MNDEIYQLNEIILKDSEKVALLENYLKHGHVGSNHPKHWHYTSFKNQLVRRRKDLGLSLENVAHYLEIGLDVYLKFEEGKQKLSAKVLVKLMDLLGVQIWELTGGKDPNAPIYAKLAEMETIQVKLVKSNEEKDTQIKVMLTNQEEFDAKQKHLESTLVAENKQLKVENKQLKARVKELESKK